MTRVKLILFLDERGEGRFFNHQKVSSEYAREFLKKYRFSNRTIDKVTNLIERHMDACNTYTKKSIKKLFNRMGENIYDLFYLQEADIKATNHQDFLENIENGRRILKEILEKRTFIFKRFKNKWQ